VAGSGEGRRASPRLSHIEADPDHASDHKRTAKYGTGKIEEVTGLSGKPHPMPGTKCSPSATCVRIMIVRHTKPSNSNQRPTVIDPNPLLPLASPLAAQTAKPPAVRSQRLCLRPPYARALFFVRSKRGASIRLAVRPRSRCYAQSTPKAYPLAAAKAD
jgi:hypothetical protein